jgi:hypothetical protein
MGRFGSSKRSVLTQKLLPNDSREVVQSESYFMSSTKEFNWDDFGTKGFGEGYSKEQRAQMEAMYADTLGEITEKEVIKYIRNANQNQRE